MPLPVIAITNESTVLSDSEVQSIIPALQHQVSSDFYAYWEQDCSLTFLPKGQPLIKGWWQIAVLDDPDQAGALGYHELSAVGTPLGKIFAKLDLQAGQSWSVTISHELLEMLIDPYICTAAQGPDGKFYAYEVCDACEADNLAYHIGSVLVSDFVTPKWFQPADSADCYDFLEHLTASLQLAPGGYIGVFDPKSGGWTQLTDDRLVTAMQQTAPVGSRRTRRSIPRADWKISTNG